MDYARSTLDFWDLDLANNNCHWKIFMDIVGQCVLPATD